MSPSENKTRAWAFKGGNYKSKYYKGEPVEKSAFGVVISKELWHGTDQRYRNSISRRGLLPSAAGSRGGGVYASSYEHGETYAGRTDDMADDFYGKEKADEMRRQRTGKGVMVAIDAKNHRSWTDADGKTYQGGSIPRGDKGSPNRPRVVHVQRTKRTTGRRLHLRLLREGNIKEMTADAPNLKEDPHKVAGSFGYRRTESSYMRNYRDGGGRVQRFRTINEMPSPFDVKGVPESIRRSQEKRQRILQENRRKHPRKSGAPGRTRAPGAAPIPGPWNEVATVDNKFSNNLKNGQKQEQSRHASRRSYQRWEQYQSNKAKQRAGRAKQAHNESQRSKAFFNQASDLNGKVKKPRGKKSLILAGSTIALGSSAAGIQYGINRRKK